MPQFEDLPTNIVDIIKAHVQLYLEDSEQAHMWDSTPVGIPGPVTTLLLTTTGRKTGKPRHVPLLYVDNGGSNLIIGSKGGNGDLGGARPGATHPPRGGRARSSHHRSLARRR